MTHTLHPADETLLAEELASIPALVEDLAAAISGGALRGASNQPRVSLGDRPSPLPYNPAASEAADHLRNELLRWVQWMCEQHLHLTGPHPMLCPMARWLTTHLALLAETPGSISAYADISSEIRAAKRATGKDRKPKPAPKPSELDEARQMELSASGVATAAKELGQWGTGLTRRRVNNLRGLGHITPIRMAGTIPVYRFGEVLDAHLTVQQRNTG